MRTAFLDIRQCGPAGRRARSTADVNSSWARAGPGGAGLRRRPRPRPTLGSSSASNLRPPAGRSRSNEEKGGPIQGTPRLTTRTTARWYVRKYASYAEHDRSVVTQPHLAPASPYGADNRRAAISTRSRLRPSTRNRQLSSLLMVASDKTGQDGGAFLRPSRKSREASGRSRFRPLWGALREWR